MHERVVSKADFVLTAKDRIIGMMGEDCFSIRWTGWIKSSFCKAFDIVREVNDGLISTIMMLAFGDARASEVETVSTFPTGSQTRDLFIT